jgi:hypothetical protein
MSDEVRGIYGELMELQQTLEMLISSKYNYIDSTVLNSYKNLLKRVQSEVPTVDTKEYYIDSHHSQTRKEEYASIDQAIIKISSLKGRIGGVFGIKDKSSEPNVSINNTQSQSQSMFLAVEWSALVTKQLDNYEVGTKESKFLNKVKEYLPFIKDGFDLIKKILEFASTVGLSVPEISRVLGFVK